MPEGIAEPYTVYRGEERAGHFNAVEPLGTFSFSSGAGDQEFAFRLPPDFGDPAPDVDLVNVSSGDSIKLSALRGKVVLVDFWATWCGPCQGAIAHMNEMAAANGEAWKDRFVVVPLSIDDDVATLKAHVASRGWTGLDHWWAGEPTGWDNPALKAFAVHGVPTSLLIGPDGRILWRGNSGTFMIKDGQPASVLDEQIDAALASASPQN